MCVCVCVTFWLSVLIIALPTKQETTSCGLQSGRRMKQVRCGMDVANSQHLYIYQLMKNIEIIHQVCLYVQCYRHHKKCIQILFYIKAGTEMSKAGKIYTS